MRGGSCLKLLVSIKHMGQLQVSYLDRWCHGPRQPVRFNNTLSQIHL